MEKGFKYPAMNSALVSVLSVFAVLIWSVAQRDWPSLLLIIGIVLAFVYHSPAPNMIDGTIVIVISLILWALMAAMESRIGGLSGLLIFFWFGLSAITGVTVDYSNKKNDGS